MKRDNSILFVIAALIALIAMAGSAQASVTVTGQVNSTAADGEIVTLWLDANPNDNTTKAVQDANPYIDYYWFDDLTPMLDRNGYVVGAANIPVTIAMYCSGTKRDINGVLGSPYTNADRSVTVVHGTVDYLAIGGTYGMPLMELESCPTETHPDLVVSNIYPQYIFSDLTNVLSVNVMNQGNASAVSCNVSLTITHTGGPTVLTGTVPALGAGSSVVVEVGNWKPTVLENIAMTAFADCDNDEPTEWDEGNNNLTETRTTTGDCAVDDMLPDTCYGYRGDNPMTTVYDGTGGVIYSVGDFKYKNNTVNFDIGASGDENQVDGSIADVPDGATIKDATLYVYYCWRNVATSPNPGTDPRPDFEMSINGGSQLTTNEYYTEIKGFGGSNSQYGTLVYDVTANVTGNGAYQAVRSNYASGKGYVSGMALLIIYDDGSGNTYAIAHGYDRLATFYKTQYKVLPEDATTTATLTDVNPNDIATANLFTVTVDAVPPGSESEQFNLCPWEVGAWDCVNGVPTCNYNYPLGINRGAVDKSDITASGTDEIVKFQERTNNGFAPVFACLQTKGGAPKVVVVAPDACVDGVFMVDVEVDPCGFGVFGVQYILSFDPSVIQIMDMNAGPFLEEGGADTPVYISEYDNGAGTASFAEVRQNTLSGAASSGVLTTISFVTVGGATETSDITLSDVVVSDEGALPIAATLIDDAVSICDANVPPTASGRSNHVYNNVGTVYFCEAELDGSQSSDSDGTIVQYGWAFGDGQYGTGMVVQHKYGSYVFTTPNYTPFTATLNVTDDGGASDADGCEVIVYIPGDANGDGTVNVLDASMVGLRWNLNGDPTGPAWPGDDMADRADLNNDRTVNILDAAIIGLCWGDNA